jgi:hypothetical protein
MWELLFLIIAANGAPVLAHALLGNHGAARVDGGRVLADGAPLFGSSKTWRGLAAALFAGGLAAPLLGLSVGIGLAAAALAMLGDLLSSFIKRRLRRTPGSPAGALDQVPEALLPGLGLMWPLGLDALDLVLLVILFTLFSRLASPLLYRLRIRRRPW